MINSKFAAGFLIGAAAVLEAAAPVTAAGTQTPAPATQAPAPAASGGSVSLELNKLEPYEKGCRAYLVVNNPSDIAYQAFKLDLVLFQSDGVIGKRFALDLVPLKAQKKTVKLFELDGVGCDKIGSFLINDVMECKSEAGAVADCFQKMTTTSLTSIQLSK